MMASGMYICNLCKREDKIDPGESFKVPADELGVAIMKEHLKTEHGVRN